MPSERLLASPPEASAAPFVEGTRRRSPTAILGWQGSYGRLRSGLWGPSGPTLPSSTESSLSDSKARCSVEPKWRGLSGSSSSNRQSTGSWQFRLWS
jgi:hypothetical protein